MNIQDLLIADRQIAIDLFYDDSYHFSYEGKDYNFTTREKVHEFFLKQTPYDTVKLVQGGQKSYVHFFHDEVEVYNTKKSLQRTLSQDGGGAWAEERSGTKRYFIEEKGWLTTTFKQVSKEECLQKLEAPSTLQKGMGIGLGILALAPGVCVFARQLPVGTKEAALGLLALNQKSPLVGLLATSCNLMAVEAQQAVGTEFQVNTYTSDNQWYPHVAALGGGGFVVVWQSDGQDADAGGIYGQRYAANDARIGAEFQVNTYTTQSQQFPSIAALQSGGFVVTWESNGQDGSTYGIYSQTYASSGVRNGAEFQVNTYITSDQRAPSIASLSSGGFVVTWESNGQEGSSYGIYGQRYDSSGVRSGTEFQVNTYTVGDQRSPQIAALTSGGFVVIWQSNGQDGDLNGVFGQRYDANGNQMGNEFRVNTYTTSIQQNPSVVGLTNGGFLATWQSNGQDVDGFGIFGQRYDANGATLGGEFRVNTFAVNNQQNPSVAALSDGGFVITWESFGQDGGGYGIYGQRYDANGTATGSEFQINTNTISNQRYPSVSALSSGGFVVTWQSSGQDGDVSGIFGQRYDANGMSIGSPSLITASTSVLPVTPSMLSTLGSTLPSSLPSTTSRMTSTLSSLRNTTAVAQLSLMPSRASEQTSLSSSMVDRRVTSLLENTTITPQVTTRDSSEPSLLSRSSRSSALLVPSQAPSSVFMIPSIVDIVYRQSYSIMQNGQIIGSYSFSGGSGQLSAGNANTLNIQLDPSYSPVEGETLVLFEVPQGQEAILNGVQINQIQFECLEPRGEVTSNAGVGRRYQLVFEIADSCASLSPKLLTSVMAMTTT